ncbi:hypothetical protein HPB51_016960 [Rhipicephalus microplus]|uniref:Uncharacterized protein n=1 Tax=Rhipicephalus microplus TaxID=6941 RepID=A0A9J6F4B9_RHIMP|nr:hypothetical protein HPB51_016960 [Rhipicephalus microplus]
MASSTYCFTKASELHSSCEDSVIHSECLFTGFLAECNLLLSVSDLGGPFRKMFPKCEDVKRYGCGRTSTAIVGEVTAGAEKTMVEALKRHAFAIAVYESSDSASQMSLSR